LYRRIAGHLSRSISAPIPIPAGPRNVVGPPTPGRVSGSGHIPAAFDRALKHVEEAAGHCTHAKTPPGESIGLPRSSTGSERVAGFGYRSPWWRVRGVRRPGVFEESLVPPAPDPRGTVPPPVTGVPARTRRASPYVPIGGLTGLEVWRWTDAFSGKQLRPEGEPSGSQLAHIPQYGRPSSPDQVAHMCRYGLAVAGDWKGGVPTQDSSRRAIQVDTAAMIQSIRVWADSSCRQRSKPGDPLD